MLLKRGERRGKGEKKQYSIIHKVFKPVGKKKERQESAHRASMPSKPHEKKKKRGEEEEEKDAA